MQRIGRKRYLSIVLPWSAVTQLVVSIPVTCPPGKQLVQNDQDNPRCIDCERGTFYDNSTMSCVGCPDNRTTTGPGAASIEYCISKGHAI